MFAKNQLFFSSIVTGILVSLFSFFIVNYEKPFELSEEFQIIPEGFVLPKGCDIKIDMQTGETFAKLNANNNDKSSALIPIDTKGEEPNSKKSPYPEYKNITKSRVQSRVSSDQMRMIEEALSSLNSEESWNYLEEESPAMEIGLAILEAQNLPELLKLLRVPEERALKIVANCLQNNPLAVEKFLDLQIHSNELVELLKREVIEKKSFIKLMRIIESISREVDFIKENRKDFMRHFEEHKDESLIERYSVLIY